MFATIGSARSWVANWGVENPSVRGSCGEYGCIGDEIGGCNDDCIEGCKGGGVVNPYEGEICSGMLNPNSAGIPLFGGT